MPDNTQPEPGNRAARRAGKRSKQDQNTHFTLPQQRVPVVQPRQFAMRRRGGAA
ncbi:hypothetical protein SAMN05216553_116132 [Lentzea fradiae]|uniref:Uncharacterized protein n=1 Tax=Lentzea fradiae TaxID=200378 RepID=A0A1G7ZWE4_9PSEU|nr:hypothetical protein [Lentzea fradiae]SDH12988.1 hypothetical protein SAMN05216553_116132 [Lentzea fradiae]